MGSIVLWTMTLAVVFGVGVVYGICIHKYRVFPYKTVQRAFHRALRNGPWSIGLYQGPTPFQLAPSPEVKNPLLTWEDVTDVDAVYVADPFLVREKGEYFLFFEVMDRETGRGKIALARGSCLAHLRYEGVVLEEPFHVSYPHVLVDGGYYYMVPESLEKGEVRLYRAEDFPRGWRFVKTLVSGEELEDPTVFYHGGRWWILASVRGGGALNLYFSESLTGEWIEHPANPLKKEKTQPLRPAGRVFYFHGRLYRLAQDNVPDYGVQVFALEILELSPERYQERLASRKPVVTKSGRGWNKRGMHHADLHLAGEKWVAVVDGRSW